MKELYIIHGWTYDATRWNKTLELLDKKGVKVHFLNVPGLTAPSKKVWTIQDYIKWADENIPNGAVALGHSNGGRILLNLCSENPSKLEKLILLDAAGIYENTPKKVITKTIAKIGKPFKKIKLIDKAFHRLTGTTDYGKAPENMKRTLENMLASDKRLNISAVTTKTAILWGKKDNITPPRHANKMNELLPNSTLKFFENWPHSAYISYSEELADAIYTEIKNA